MVDPVQVASPQLGTRRPSRYHYDLHLKELPAISISPDFVLSPGNKDMDQSEVFKQLNDIKPEDASVPPAEILQPQGNHNHIDNVTPSEELTPAILSSPSSSSEEEGSSGSQEDMVANEMEELQKELVQEEKQEEKELDEDGLFDDPKLLETTEKNRHIPYHDLERKETAEKVDRNRDPRLIFTAPVLTERPDRVQVTQYYGKTDEIYPRRRRMYMVACDFSRESIAALDWTMGTIMRDGEEVHVVTVVNRDEDTRKNSSSNNNNNNNSRKLSPVNELHVASIGVTDQAKSILGQMRLYDIKLVTTVIRGRPKEVLPNLINELPFTMVVCGCRGRSTMKEMLMGSISSFLLHKSSVPVSVIRYQKKKQKKGKKPQAPQSLSKSVETGQLVVDELSSKKS